MWGTAIPHELIWNMLCRAVAACCGNMAVPGRGGVSSTCSAGTGGELPRAMPRNGGRTHGGRDERGKRDGRADIDSIDDAAAGTPHGV